MLFGLFRRKTRDAEHNVYCQIVAQARQPVFYTDFGVPDTIDGRFDLIVVHAVLLFRRLRGEGAAVSRFAQNVFDLFFHDMDASLRELGVSDVRVPKKIKVMGEAFYGRADAYMPAIESGDAAALAEALQRNVYVDVDGGKAPEALARYMIAAAKNTDGQETKSILSGDLRFPDPAEFAVKDKTDDQ
ncbi:ubiquinol-cytochrome C chaperone family protein [Roseibium sp.]|uniref:ubiquinol-cytochrome C chaperone family protein n=1 Tax=Roseibium sp. TaxID=1936156 RepID=UPI003A974507